MADDLKGCTVAVLATDRVEGVELTGPVKALKEAGAHVQVVSDKEDEIQAFQYNDKGNRIPVDTRLNEADAEKFDAPVLPGEVVNPDALRLVPSAIDFVRHFVEKQKPVAAMCHRPWTLIDAGGVRGRIMTSWPSLKTDLRNAGATWVDQVVVCGWPTGYFAQAGRLVCLQQGDDRKLQSYPRFCKVRCQGRLRRRSARPLGAVWR